MVKIYCGIEVEAEVNGELLSVEKLGYHSHADDPNFVNFGKYFKTESDGSLSIRKWRTHGITAEFISKRFEITEYKEITEGFESTLKEKAKAGYDGQLGSIVEFNNTTGCHIHISMKSDNGVVLPFKMLSTGKLIKFNNKLLTRIKEEMPEVYPEFSKSFYRGYAKKRIEDGDRYSCWNFTLNDISRLEFRSFNLRGVTNWKQFHDIFKIVFEEIETLCKTTLATGFEFKSQFSKAVSTNFIKSISQPILEKKCVIIDN